MALIAAKPFLSGASMCSQQAMPARRSSGGTVQASLHHLTHPRISVQESDPFPRLHEPAGLGHVKTMFHRSGRGAATEIYHEDVARALADADATASPRRPKDTEGGIFGLWDQLWQSNQSPN
mmetsp:Transcript_40879/g.130595  ORF Transcript_40879/g.130595 Transcript_40879/m.130595 type:complete len:122 (+) Transcript_40879:61-426(+)|eukprot:CAMPEP_0182902446 /NCGR_PEP_ID=MMETSP0034_2-20130328/30478_1 /TAXON_ID=156128 /ORGANISM="Nephroselmis pyriformis, Strain CCMP717" /LENGTH=121 /DNA_ID=CAMNT_0025037113 /DNA_START=41 /DNA_END=406 /DNA_ORIENTATION=+